MAGLLQFSERPNAGDTKRSYPILRCDPEQKYRVAGFILSPRIFGVNVHFVGKSVPCSAPKEACTWCDAGRPLRWVGYAPACDLDRHKMFLFEFTPGVMPVFEAFLTMHDSLRGAFVNLSRRKPRPNSRLDAVIQPAGKYLAPGDLPPAFDVEEVLERIYGLTAVSTETEVAESITAHGEQFVAGMGERDVAFPDHRPVTDAVPIGADDEDDELDDDDFE